MSNIAIKVENLGKKYTIRHEKQESYKTFQDVLIGSGKKIISSLNPFGTSSAIEDETTEEFWALKDVNFEINKGDKVGIIGRNGAGKSTLLKVLSRITEPTTGKIHINGRIASLLEVGTGFHPELTGRENIYLNGAILGMSRAEIRDKFDEIVAFAEVDKFLDTPVKRYSSGMYVRLAFSVAAHLEPEILVVDEVLAVGDIEFQKKCLGKMDDVASEGRTIIFVSHNMDAISGLCSKGILLANGQIGYIGSTSTAIQKYLSSGQDNRVSAKAFSGPLKNIIIFHSLEINGNKSSGINIDPKENIQINVIVESKKDLVFRFDLSIYKGNIRLFRIHDLPKAKMLSVGKYLLNFFIPSNILRPGTYSISLGGRKSLYEDWINGKNICDFIITKSPSVDNDADDDSLVIIPSEGSREKLENRD